MNYLYLFIIPIGFMCRAINYHRRVIFLVSFHKTYMDYIGSYVDKEKSGKDDPKHAKLTIRIQRNQEYAKKYILEAGIGNPHISRAEPLGLGFVDTRGISVLDNFAYLGNTRIVDNIKQCLQRAIGYYERVRNENFNPIFWIEYILVKAPKSVLSNVIDIIKKAFNS